MKTPSLAWTAPKLSGEQVVKQGRILIGRPSLRLPADPIARSADALATMSSNIEPEFAGAKS